MQGAYKVILANINRGLLGLLFPEKQEEKRETNILPWKSCFQREKTDLISLKQWLLLLAHRGGWGEGWEVVPIGL